MPFQSLFHSMIITLSVSVVRFFILFSPFLCVVHVFVRVCNFGPHWLCLWLNAIVRLVPHADK